MILGLIPEEPAWDMIAIPNSFANREPNTADSALEYDSTHQQRCKDQPTSPFRQPAAAIWVERSYGKIRQSKHMGWYSKPLK